MLHLNVAFVSDAELWVGHGRPIIHRARFSASCDLQVQGERYPAAMMGRLTYNSKSQQ